MADWQRKLVLQPEWGWAQEGKISIHEMARVLASRLKTLRAFGDDSLDDERDELVEEFESIAEDASANTSDFDDVMYRLYDWGDTPMSAGWNGKKACWIDTISRAPAENAEAAP